MLAPLSIGVCFIILCGCRGSVESPQGMELRLPVSRESMRQIRAALDLQLPAGKEGPRPLLMLRGPVPLFPNENAAKQVAEKMGAGPLLGSERKEELLENMMAGPLYHAEHEKNKAEGVMAGPLYHAEHEKKAPESVMAGPLLSRPGHGKKEAESMMEAGPLYHAEKAKSMMASGRRPLKLSLILETKKTETLTGDPEATLKFSVENSKTETFIGN